MKKFFLISGGVIILALIAFGFYEGMTLLEGIYLYTHREEFEERLAKSSEQAQLKSVAQETERLAQLKKSLDDQPSFFVDREGYQTEDNWLAANIIRELTGMSFEVMHPGDPLPDFHVKTQVDPDKPQVRVEVTGVDEGDDADVYADLTPTFAWDAQGYAPLAQKLLDRTKIPSFNTLGDNATDILAHLQNLTAYDLAQEDVRLSANLQQNPASWQDHEAAALALTALALRENAGFYSDDRTLLCRATAHLALAQVLRQNQSETWPGLIADAAIRMLTGREVNAMADLDSLAARTDCPESAKPWIMALRLRAKDDWRIAEVKSNSPLLVKIAWFQVLADDLTDMAATHRLNAILPAPTDDSSTTNNQTQDSSVWDLPDWGRAVLVSPLYLSVENGHRFTENNITLELKEINDVMKVEGGDPVNAQNVTTAFAEGESGTISKDANGKVLVRVIGRGTFKAATRRHLVVAIRSAYDWMKRDLGLPEDAEAFRAQMDATFRGIPQGEFLWEGMENPSQEELKRRYDVWHEQNKTWNVWALPPGTGSSLPGYSMVKAFYARGVPFGTVYRVEQRLGFINAIGEEDDTTEFNAIVAKVKQLPLSEQPDAFHKLSAPLNAKMQADVPHGPTALEQKLLKLAPDRYDLVVDHVPVDKLLPVVGSFLDYNIRPIKEIESLYRKYINDSTHELIWRRHAALEPDGYFGLADFLREEGKFDEAAEMDRKGVAEGYDQVLMSNSVWELVDYDLNHGLNDEAEKVAQSAADTGSERGLGVQMYLQEREGKLDEAEATGKAMEDRYSPDISLSLLYAGHKDHFPEKYAEAERKLFPDGLLQVDLSSFFQKPESGCKITGDSPLLKEAGFRQNDVIVAIDGHQVNSRDQYVFLSAIPHDSKVGIIVWRNQKYMEMQTSLPGQKFYGNLADYGNSQ